MQERHFDREAYFHEEARTSRAYYIDYIRRLRDIRPGMTVLEVGCGEGGNLLPFAEMGCRVTGIDRLEERAEQASAFFEKAGKQGRFLAADFLNYTPAEGERYDVVLVHDVIEHIADKDTFVKQVLVLLAPGGVVFWGFPAWQMPFGGHQQMCKSRLCSHLPYFHLLPMPLYRGLLKAMGEKPGTIGELADIKRCRTSIETFERLCRRHGLHVADRTLWFINPHYEQKFHLKPRKLWKGMAALPYLRNFVTTGCFYFTTNSSL